MKKISILLALLSLATGCTIPTDPSSRYKDVTFEITPDPALRVIKKSCPQDYPAEALRNHESGTVEFMAMISAEGIVTKSKLVNSSGSRNLDIATLTQIIGCQLKPKMTDGVAIDTWVPLKFNWILP